MNWNSGDRKQRPEQIFEAFRTRAIQHAFGPLPLPRGGVAAERISIQIADQIVPLQAGRPGRHWRVAMDPGQLFPIGLLRKYEEAHFSCDLIFLRTLVHGGGGPKTLEALAREIVNQRAKADSPIRRAEMAGL